MVGETEIGRLVGMFIERAALSGPDPTSPYGNDGHPVQARMDQLAQQRAAIQDLA